MKGLNSIKKRWLALKEFRTSGADVILIQETHFHAGGSLRFTSNHFPVSYMALDSSGKAGIAVLIRHSCPLQIQSSHLDPHGWYIILQYIFLSSPLTLMNVYAPNSGQLNFLTETFDLQHFSRPFTVVGGDFNAILSSTRDRRSLFQTKLPLPMQSLASSFCQLAWAHHQFDAWRIKHPTSRQFSFYPPPPQSVLQIRLFLCDSPPSA